MSNLGRLKIHHHNILSCCCSSQMICRQLNDSSFPLNPSVGQFVYLEYHTKLKTMEQLAQSSWIFRLPDDIVKIVVVEFIHFVSDYVRLDSAVCSKAHRPTLLRIFSNVRVQMSSFIDYRRRLQSMAWASVKSMSFFERDVLLRSDSSVDLLQFRNTSVSSISIEVNHSGVTSGTIDMWACHWMIFKSASIAVEVHGYLEMSDNSSEAFWRLLPRHRVVNLSLLCQTNMLFPNVMDFRWQSLRHLHINFVKIPAGETLTKWLEFIDYLHESLQYLGISFVPQFSSHIVSEVGNELRFDSSRFWPHLQCIDVTRKQSSNESRLTPICERFLSLIFRCATGLQELSLKDIAVSQRLMTDILTYLIWRPRLQVLTISIDIEEYLLPLPHASASAPWLSHDPPVTNWEIRTQFGGVFALPELWKLLPASQQRIVMDENDRADGDRSFIPSSCYDNVHTVNSERGSSPWTVEQLIAILQSPSVSSIAVNCEADESLVELSRAVSHMLHQPRKSLEPSKLEDFRMASIVFDIVNSIDSVTVASLPLSTSFISGLASCFPFLRTLDVQVVQVSFDILYYLVLHCPLLRAIELGVVIVEPNIAAHVDGQQQLLVNKVHSLRESGLSFIGLDMSFHLLLPATAAVPTPEDSGLQMNGVMHRLYQIIRRCKKTRTGSFSISLVVSHVKEIISEGVRDRFIIEPLKWDWLSLLGGVVAPVSQHEYTDKYICRW